MSERAFESQEGVKSMSVGSEMRNLVRRKTELRRTISRVFCLRLSRLTISVDGATKQRLPLDSC